MDYPDFYFKTDDLLLEIPRLEADLLRIETIRRTKQAGAPRHQCLKVLLELANDLTYKTVLDFPGMPKLSILYWPDKFGHVHLTAMRRLLTDYRLTHVEKYH